MMSLHTSDYSRLTSAIYEAPLSCQGWQPVLNLFKQTFDSEWAQMYVEGLYGKQTPLSALEPLDTVVLKNYEEYYFDKDPRAYALRLGDDRARARHEIVPDSDFVNTEIYNDYLVPAHGEQSLILSIKGLSAGTNFFAVVRPEVDGRYSAEQASTLTGFARHINQALKIQQYTSNLAESSRKSASVLDLLAVGVLLVDQKGCVTLVNKEAQRIMSNGVGITIDRLGYCRLDVTDQNKQFYRLLSCALDDDVTVAQASGGSMIITNGVKQRPLTVTITRIGLSEMDVGSRPVSAAVFIADADNPPLSCPQVLTALYGLTPAEARLAIAIADGQSLKAYAERHTLTLNTVRSTLKIVMMKLGIRRQVELARLLLKQSASYLCS